MHASQKKLNEMNRLSDMAHFPALVNAGATLNILLTLCLTWWLVALHKEPWAPMLWIALVLFLNLLPVLLLRFTLKPNTTYPTLANMNFVHDQHKFSDWVYLAASANMAFWVLGSWAVFTINPSVPTLAVILIIAAIATFSPVLIRFKR